MYDYGSQNKLVNIHGHIHRNPSPSSHHINVCVEQNNYYPFHVDELIEKAKELNLE
jgi:calcineurin-like phosphoesterase family protein